MKHPFNLKTAAACLLLASISGLSYASTPPSNAKMWEMLKKQQKQIESLKKENKLLSEKININADMSNQPSQKPIHKPAHKISKTVNSHSSSIGGYGELHYNNLDSGNEIDFHRFVLFFSHDFTNRTRFFSELELEHVISGNGKTGEIELEQAYIEHDLTNKLLARAGLFLMPVGILNETHEPNTFYGVERNPVEKNIIPTTWWEAGLALSGRINTGWSYDVALTSGLSTPTTGSNAYLIRNGRKQAAKAPANDAAITARLSWTGIPGVKISATVQRQQDITQGTDSTAGAATLFETNAVIQKGAFSLRALYAQWKLDGSGPAALGRDKQKGWYIEPAYKLTPKLGLFARYNKWDNNAGNSAATETKQTNYGINYWLHENVVFKADIQKQSGASSNDGFNLGMGYQF